MGPWGKLSSQGSQKFRGNVVKDISGRTMTVISGVNIYFLTKENKIMRNERKQDYA